MSHSAPTPPTPLLGALREVPFMGVIYVVHEASKLGFRNGHPDWCNLGQGQPEVGPMAGAPPHFLSVLPDTPHVSMVPNLAAAEPGM